ncbi:MAG TPA: zf-HC2 domain-containing protein [Sphingomonas sp.]|nr:zf-HC2 domain-containing protein [Sphingomonas sp.]
MDNIRIDEAHEQVQQLLPWFVTGKLDDADQTRVSDHLATCAACRAELAAERRLGANVAEMPVDVDLNWAAMRQRIEATPARYDPWRRPRRMMRRFTNRPRLAGLMIAAQIAALVLAVVVITPLTRPAPYHALAGAQAEAAGNVLVMFRPDARAADMSALLARNGARIVDGPTAGGAFVVAVAPARRAAVLADLRGRPALTMAEPIDP